MSTLTMIEDEGRTIPLMIKSLLFFNLFFMFFFFRDPLDFYVGYLFILILFPIYIVKFGVPRDYLLVFSVFLLSGLAHIVLKNNDLGSFTKVFSGMAVSYLFFYYVVFELKLDIHQLFRYYLFGALLSATVAFVQMFSYVAGFRMGYDLTWIHHTFTTVPGGLFGIRVSAFFGEPTYLAMFASGGVFVAIHDLIYQNRAYYFNRPKAILMLVGIYASFSGTLVGTMVLSVFLIGVNYGFLRYLLLGFPLAIVALVYIVTSTEDFERRYSGTLNLFLDAPQEEFNVFDYHGSSVILYNNFFIAKENLKQNLLFGTGIGSHPVATEKFSLTKNVTVRGFNLNTKDANSMFNRLMSETGLFGLGLAFFIIFKHFIRRREEDDDQLWLISAACLVVIFVNLLRQGHYFLNGFPFYVWMYIRAYQTRKVGDMSMLEESEVQNK